MTSLDVIRDPDGIKAIAPAWDAALLKADNPDVSLSSHWISQWMQAFDADGRVRVLHGKAHDGTTVAQAAFLKSSSRALPRLSTMANTYANRSAITVCDDGAEMLRGWISDQGAPIVRLGRYASNGPHWDIVPNPALRKSHMLPVIAVDQTYDSFLACRSGNFRRSLKRAKAAHKGLKIAFTERPWDHVDDMLAVSRSTWKHKAGTAIASQPAVEKFYTGLLKPQNLSPTSYPFLILVYDEAGVPVAFLMGLIFNGVMYALKNGFDPRVQNRNPGFAIMNSAVELACSDPGISLVDVDVHGPRGDFKLRWATDTRYLESIVGFPNSPRGLVARGLWKARRKVAAIGKQSLDSLKRK